MTIWLVGIPGSFGGGDMERGHAALLWRRAGLDVKILHFTQCPCGKPIPQPPNLWTQRMLDAGCEYVAGQPGKLHEVPGLAGGTLVSFCHHHAMHSWPELSRMGCRLIWSPCMSYMTNEESRCLPECPPTVVHFQSQFQASQTGPIYRSWGCQKSVVIPGAFTPLPFRPRPRRHGEPLVVGRLARACRTKWSPWIWNILEEVRKRGIAVEALCQAWSQELTDHCGEPPDWASCLPADTLTPEEFMARCHIVICPNWCVPENWPQVGLEAMSAGVPLVVDAQGGWLEMLDKDSGILCYQLREYPDAIEKLAQDDGLRQQMALRARERVLDLIDAETITRAWVSLLEDLEGCRAAA